MRDRRIDQLDEVVRQNLRRQTDRDTVGTLRQQQREFHGKRHRLLVTAVVGAHPLGRLLVENHVEGEFRQAGFDVTARSGFVAGEDVAPVAPTVYQQVLLSQLHQRILDRSVAVRVILHGLAHDIGHLVVTTVIDGFHGVQNTPLHRLESVLHVRNGSFQDDIRSVIEEPITVHTRQLAHAALLGEQLAVFARRSGGLFGPRHSVQRHPPPQEPRRADRPVPSYLLFVRS